MRVLSQEARVFFGSGARSDRQRRFEFDRVDILEGCGPALLDLFNGRCAFCTSEVSDSRMIAHRFRPAQGAVSEDGGVARSHYFWLAYMWDNLYLACGECNSAKGAKFPVSGSRSRVGGSVEAETALILDPCGDDPEASLVYRTSGEVEGENDRAQTTIDVLALNRASLVAARRATAREAADAFGQISRAYDREEYGRCAELMRDGYSTDRPYAAVFRQFLNQRVQGRRRQLGQALDAVGMSLDRLVGSLRRITATHLSDSYQLATRSSEPRARAVTLDGWLKHGKGFRATRSEAVRAVRIRNFKGIRDVELTLDASPGVGNWTMLLGENGVGKTSILQALGLALVGATSVERLKLTPADVLRQRARSGSIEVWLESRREPLRVDFSLGEPFQFSTDSGVAVAGYGATRLLHDTGAREASYGIASIANLFSPFASLVRTEKWVPDLSESNFDAMAGALRRLLEIDDEDSHISRSAKGELFLVHGERRVKLNRQSSGIQAMAALGLDMVRFFLETWGSVEAAEGVALVDEIDAHLHPTWQFKVVDSLREIFPRVQFIATTHSPLVLRGLRPGEARVLHRGHNDEVHLDIDPPTLGGMTIDQLLTSETFGMSTTMDPAIEREFERYYELLAARNLAPSEEDEVIRLQDSLDEQRYMGSTRRERIMLETIDEYLARERAGDQLPGDLSEETRDYLLRTWSQGRPR